MILFLLKGILNALEIGRECKEGIYDFVLYNYDPDIYLSL